VALRWIAKMVQDIPLFKEHILQNVEKFDWTLDFLEENIHAKKGFFTIMDTELKAKVPIYLKTAFEIVKYCDRKTF